jgi:methionine-rich copper-binding protein CopC
MSGKKQRVGMLVVLAMALASCGTTPSPSPSVVRPSSPAVVSIVEPAAGQTVSGTVHVVLSLTGAKIVSQTSTNIRPDEGHVHLFVDNVLKSMNYGLEQDLDLPPGTYVLSAEFVAADHAPFNPRVVSGQTIFSVQ